MNTNLEKLINAYKNETEKKCYQINLVDGKTSILDDKIGGIPYLPNGESYPIDETGKMMGLVLQVNLKNIKLDNWPTSGILEIFIDSSLKYPCQYEIRYYDEGLDYQTNLPYVSLEGFIVDEPIKIEIEEAICHKPLSNFDGEETLLNIAKKLFKQKFNTFNELDDFINTSDFYVEFMESLSIPYGTIGGYADFIQNDPREYEGKERTDCLLKLDCCLDNERLYIGDTGILFVLIKPEDIINKKFENGVVDWDCY